MINLVKLHYTKKSAIQIQEESIYGLSCGYIPYCHKDTTDYCPCLYYCTKFFTALPNILKLMLPTIKLSQITMYKIIHGVGLRPLYFYITSTCILYCLLFLQHVLYFHYSVKRTRSFLYSLVLILYKRNKICSDFS